MLEEQVEECVEVALKLVQFVHALEVVPANEYVLTIFFSMFEYIAIPSQNIEVYCALKLVEFVHALEVVPNTDPKRWLYAGRGACTEQKGWLYAGRGA